MQFSTQTLQLLSEQFRGKVLIPFIAASEAIGLAEQTARNRLSKKTFPIPTVVIGRRRFIHISILAAYVDSLATPKPSRGRPSKAEQIARLAKQGRA
jgi:hypothetical protein